MASANTLGLTIWALGPHHFLDVDQGESEEIIRAMADLKEAVAIEQKFDLLLENLLEQEREFLDRALMVTLRGFQSTHDLLDDQLAFARRLLNLLSAARTYVDHVKHHMSSIYPHDLSVADTVKGLFSSRYDASLSYRTMEALRNFSQHRGMPVHGFSYDNRRVEDDADNPRIETNVLIRLDVDVLREEGGFKATVLNELEATGLVIDLKPIARQYVQDLGEVHVALRQLIEQRVEKAKVTLRTWRERFAAAAGVTSLTGLALVDRSDPDRGKNLTGLADTSLGYLDRLRQRNGSLANLASRTTSSRALPAKVRAKR